MIEKPRRAKTGGRQPGTPNRIGQEVRDLASAYGPEAVRLLARLMRSGETEALRLAAAKEILDRAVGRPPQAPTVGDEDGPVAFSFTWLSAPVVDDPTRQD